MTRHDDDDVHLSPLDRRTRRLLDAAAAPQALPAALRSRLLSLPAAAESEDEMTRRYERGCADGLAEGRAEGRTERAIAGWIAEARRPARLPAALRSRLLGIGRAARRPLPFWLVDVRYAAAACLILTLVSTVLVEDASALLGERAAQAGVARQEWQARLGESVTSRGEDAVATLVRGWHRGRQALFSRGEAARDLFEEKLRIFNQTELGLRLAGEPQAPGEKNGSR